MRLQSIPLGTCPQHLPRLISMAGTALVKSEHLTCSHCPNLLSHQSES